ncbi:MAG: hypothetical protein HLUCCA11_19395 [Phormidesmis priestleyi Ana]|uniref:Uncharacterized protein n=1 Tax=Phormidesmis priestleyi Ana TaxID=1666911 RepID=A0A0P8BWB5_9CYAN|nr:MAG: hypothetical protein HLUCCA11_19395 [Phormidesmis priestleyi Ana]
MGNRSALDAFAESSHALGIPIEWKQLSRNSTEKAIVEVPTRWESQLNGNVMQSTHPCSEKLLGSHALGIPIEWKQPQRSYMAKTGLLRSHALGIPIEWKQVSHFLIFLVKFCVPTRWESQLNGNANNRGYWIIEVLQVPTRWESQLNGNVKTLFDKQLSALRVPTRWESQLNGNQIRHIYCVSQQVLRVPTRWESQLNGNIMTSVVAFLEPVSSHALGIPIEWKQPYSHRLSCDYRPGSHALGIPIEWKLGSQALQASTGSAFPRAGNPN